MTPVNDERRYVTVDQQVDLKAMPNTSVLVSAQIAGLLEVFHYDDVAENHACMAVKRNHGCLLCPSFSHRNRQLWCC